MCPSSPFRRCLHNPGGWIWLLKLISMPMLSGSQAWGRKCVPPNHRFGVSSTFTRLTGKACFSHFYKTARKQKKIKFSFKSVHYYLGQDMLKALYTTLSDSGSAVIHSFGQSPTISPSIYLADLTVCCLSRSWATNCILKVTTLPGQSQGNC